VQLRKFSAYLSLYTALTGCFLLGAWFIWRSFNTLTYFLAERKLNASEITQSVVGRQSGFIAMAWIIIAGVVLLILIVFAESYFTTGITKGNLYKRMARILGLLLILIFIIDLTALSLKGWAANWLYWCIMAAELGGGGILASQAQK
jgi:hypothetical protein